MIKTKITELLGIQYPIFQGGMAWVADAKLAAAVSNAGGLGLIGAASAPGEVVEAMIKQAKSLTDKPFGVNIMLMSPFADDVAKVCVEQKIAVVTTGAGNPGKYMDAFKGAGIKVIPVVPSAALAKRMERAGADAVVAEGCESGGHIGELTTMALLPQVVDAVSIPVIGAGGIADRRTIPGMMLAKNAELIAVMDINAEQVEKIRQKYGAKRGYTKEEDLLADPEVDAVYIATPIVLHAKQAKLAADYGKDILIEKPLAMTSDEGQEVIEYCESKGVKIAAGFMMRFGSHVMSMKKAIAEGKIGTVVSGYSQFTLWLPYEPGNWRQCKAKAGGGAMMDLSVHTIDLMEYITGMRVTEVASMNEKIAFPEPQYDVEDTSTILMRMENGAQCVVQSNFNIPDEASKWRVEFFGTKGRLLGDTMIGQIDGGKLNAVFIDKNVAYSAEQTHADDVGIEIPGDFGNMYTREIESFSDSILNDKPLVVPASDAVHVQRIMEKAYASGEELKILKI